MPKEKYQVAVVYFDNGDGERTADVFVHIVGADPLSEFMQFCDNEYGEGHNIEASSANIHFLNDLVDKDGKIYRATIRRRKK